jgi:hypothetical protein
MMANVGSADKSELSEFDRELFAIDMAARSRVASITSQDGSDMNVDASIHSGVANHQQHPSQLGLHRLTIRARRSCPIFECLSPTAQIVKQRRRSRVQDAELSKLLALVDADADQLRQLYDQHDGDWESMAAWWRQSQKHVTGDDVRIRYLRMQRARGCSVNLSCTH